ncbi:alpha/beta hydrolase [Boudabousia marimammalium]|uniref:Esterase n=1 Tax=Boudabousia marimammalium TaxID=156892 RepID=A0A1Q5PRU5_9ACTO|nr:alpha/beta hydrolase-fold protein [Boudabousia marimammalium]OKL50253.1 hypothetical protein BM477_02350 [Boudabousia marimammalium]
MSSLLPLGLFGRPISLVGPTAITTTVVAFILSLLLAGLLVSKRQKKRPIWWRLGGLGLGVAATLMAFVILVNAMIGFYPTTTELIDEDGSIPVTEVKQLSPLTPPLSQQHAGREQLLEAPQSISAQAGKEWHPEYAVSAGNNGAVRLLTEFTGPLSGITLPVYIWAPRGFNLNNPAGQPKYRVIQLLHGSPGNAEGSQHVLRAGDLLQNAIDQGKIPPTIMVFPDLNVDGREPDCVDLQDRPRVETWAAKEIPTMIRSLFPQVSDQRSDWTLMGVSAGAYCAVRTGLAHPEVFGSIVSFSGYNRPIIGLLTQADVETYNANTLTTIIALPRKYPSRVLLASNSSDADADRVAFAVNEISLLPGDEFAKLTLTGGHNWGAWSDGFPDAMSWLAGDRTIGRIQPLGKGLGANHASVNAPTEGWWGIRSVIMIVLIAVISLMLSFFTVSFGKRPLPTRHAESTRLRNLRVFLPHYLLSLMLVAASSVLLVLTMFMIFNANLEFYASWQDVVREVGVLLATR